MGVTAAIIGAAAAAGGTAQAIDSSRVARHTASDAAKRERDALAALQATPEPVIPVADDATVRQAKRRSIASQIARRGRQSTILSDSNAADALGA